MIRPQFTLDLNYELLVDNFAGGGGASTGIEMGTGRHVDHAANHALDALGMHRINHPQTVHHCEDIFDIEPEVMCGGRPVALAHFSPDCKHFSKAKGGKPLDKRIRGLMLSMLKWAKYGVRMMTMENVVEIKTWGPLIEIFKNGAWGWYPDPENIGRTWNAVLDILQGGIDPDHPDLPYILEVLAGAVSKEECVRGFGYTLEFRELRACDYGSPTIRKRLFMIARRDGTPIVWPQPSHFEKPVGKQKPWRTIAECIDWQLPCPSIFLTAEKARVARCKRPLAKATLRRIAMGIDRYVLKAKRPFLVSLTHQGGDRIESIDQPARTVTGAHRGEKAVVSPVTLRTDMPQSNASCVYPPEEPLRTITTSGGFGVGEAKLAPVITEHANATHQRNMPADEPLRTQCAQVKGGHFAMVAGSLTRFNGDHAGREDGANRNQPPDQPITTQDTSNRFGVISAHLAVQTTDHTGGAATEPLKTIATGGHHSLVTGTLVGAGGPARSGEPMAVDRPDRTQLTRNDRALAAASMVKLRGDNVGDEVNAPLHTVSAGGTHHGVVAASVVRHFGESVGQPVDAPAPTTVAGGGGKTGLIAAHMTKFNTGATGSAMDEPITTIPAGSHKPETHGGAATPHGTVAAYLAQHNGGFNENPGHPAHGPSSTVSASGSQQNVVTGSLAAYYGNDEAGQGVTEPARTVTVRDRLGFVRSDAVIPELTPEQIAGARVVAAFLRDHGVQFEGEFATVEGYVIVDIGMRMLTPRELFRAQGFPDTYVIDRAWVVDPETGDIAEIRLTKEQQIRMCGNSVCPQVMAAIVSTNMPELRVRYGDEKKELVTV